jgi:hypothetical protein
VFLDVCFSQQREVKSKVRVNAQQGPNRPARQSFRACRRSSNELQTVLVEDCFQAAHVHLQSTIRCLVAAQHRHVSL